MKVLLTGISGRVGRACARDFLNNGHEVRGFDRTALPEEFRGRVEMVYGELTDRLTVLKAAEGCDAICHLAAIATPGHRDDVIFNTNITGTQYMLAAAEGHGIKSLSVPQPAARMVFFTRNISSTRSICQLTKRIRRCRKTYMRFPKSPTNKPAPPTRAAAA